MRRERRGYHAHSRHRGQYEKTFDAEFKETAALAGAHGHDALLRKQHAHARFFRTRRQISGRGYGERFRVVQFRAEGRNAHRHGQDAGRNEERRHRDPPSHGRRAAPAREKRAGERDQRGRRHERAPHAGAFRSLYHARKIRFRQGTESGDFGRYQAFPRGEKQSFRTDETGRGSTYVRPRDAHSAGHGAHGRGHGEIPAARRSRGQTS